MGFFITFILRVFKNKGDSLVWQGAGVLDF